jgi:hypothetical protein
VEQIVTHIPHLVPLVGVTILLGRLWIVERRKPPADLSDEELGAWREAHRRP